MIITEWQTIVAVTIVASCGVWLAWRLLRPFTERDADACGGDNDPELIQIEPAQTDTGAGTVVKAEPRPR